MVLTVEISLLATVPNILDRWLKELEIRRRDYSKYSMVAIG